jgi:hypothetical protein
MSVVTNIILTFSSAEEEGESEVYPALEPIQNFLERQPLKPVRECAGGYKTLEVEVWVCAANYLDAEEFAKTVYGAPWRYPGHVQLMLKEQDDVIFEVTTVPGDVG